LKLAFVVQRYGLDIAGGAEYHCRIVAEHLARHTEVEVLTTCAADYITWDNHYPEGIEVLNGIPVRRFKVKHPRDPERFAEWTERVLRGDAERDPLRGSDPRGWRSRPGSPLDSRRAERDSLPRSERGVGGVRRSTPQLEKDELRWLEEEGPFSPRLVRHVLERRDDHDFFVFFSYRYYTTYHGLRAVRDKALLVPTAEDDGIHGIGIFAPFFRLPRAIVYNSVEEREMIRCVSGNDDVPGDVVGVGSELPASQDADGFRRRHGLTEPFALYVGRIDDNKGCRQMFDFFRRYRAESGSNLRLVLIGRAVLPIPRDPGIVHLGFLPDHEKWDALAACELLVMPSRYESLSMVTLEAWWAGRPVLANAKCEVLRGQCRRSNAGLYYSSYPEFRESLALLEGDAALRQALGRNGRRYFELNYAWDVVERKYLDLLDRARREDREPAPPQRERRSGTGRSSA
jgi:glycosyltransferase involved in cell wall biosynthesis